MFFVPQPIHAPGGGRSIVHVKMHLPRLWGNVLLYGFQMECVRARRGYDNHESRKYIATPIPVVVIRSVNRTVCQETNEAQSAGSSTVRSRPRRCPPSTDGPYPLLRFENRMPAGIYRRVAFRQD